MNQTARYQAVGIDKFLAHSIVKALGITQAKVAAVQLNKKGLLTTSAMMEVLGVAGMSESKCRTKEEAAKMAAEEGLVAFFPEDDELMCDYDEVYETSVMKAQARIGTSPFKVLAGEFDLQFVSQLFTRSKSGHAHLYIKMNMKVDYRSRMLIQALLGSDPTREAYNLIRVMSRVGDDRKYDMALFETPDQAVLVKKWRFDYKIVQLKARIDAARAARIPF